MTELTFALSGTSFNSTDPTVLVPNYPISVLYISNQNITLYDSANNIVDFDFDTTFNEQSLVAVVKLIPRTPYKPSQIYSIFIRNIKGASNSELITQYLNFYVNPAVPQRNINDIYYQLENLSNLTSFEAIIDNGDYLNYKKSPESYNFETNRYSTNVDADGAPIVLDVRNDLKIKDLIINQFLYEYRNYLNDINNYKELPSIVSLITADNIADEMTQFEQDVRDLNAQVLAGNPDAVYNIENFLLAQYKYIVSAFISSYNTDANRVEVNISEEALKKLNLLIINNISRLNGTKGVLGMIEIVLGIYIKMLGFQLISVIPDGDKNFRYRVSCSLPTSLWRQIIRPIVHPCGWFDMYNYVDSVLQGDQIEVGRDRLDLLRVIRSSWRPDCTSYLDAENYAKLENQARYKLLKQFSHITGGINAANALVHEGVSGLGGHAECTWTDPYDHTKFGLTFAGNTSSLDYTQSGLTDELYSPFNGSSFGINRSVSGTANNSYSMKFGKPGIALEYLWKVYQRNKLIEIIRTPFNTLDINFNTKPTSGGYTPYEYDYQVVLELKHEDWTREIFNYNSQDMPFYRYGIIREGSYRRSMIGTRNNFSLGANMLNIGVAGLETEFRNVALTTNNITNYNFYAPAVSGVWGVDQFAADFDYSAAVFSYYEIPVTGSAGTPMRKMNVWYWPEAMDTNFLVNHVGIGSIFDRYIWDVYKLGVKIHTIVTTINSVDIYLPLATLGDYQLNLTVVVNDVQHPLTNYLTFV